MVPFCHLHIGGTGIRGVQILPNCIGDRARVSKEQAWMSQGSFCAERVHYFFKTMIFFHCIIVRASKGYFVYNPKKVVLFLSKSWQMTPWFEFGCPKQVVYTQGKCIFLAKDEIFSV